MNEMENVPVKLLKSVFDKYSKQIVCAYVFGSLADNSYVHGSDIDIAVLLRKAEKSDYFEAKLSLYADLSRALKRNDIDLVILNLSKNLILKDEIVRKGLPVYETDKGVRFDYELKIQHMTIDFKYQRKKYAGV